MARLAIAAVLTLALAPAAAADTVDVPSAAHLTIVGEAPGLGYDVAGAGDVNGDGVPDVVVSDNEFTGAPPDSYVVFGRRTPATVHLGSLGSGGFKIIGAGYSVAGAGDVNHDGLADVLLTDPRASFNGREQSGSAYVVFGKTTATTVDVASLGSAGFRIDGPVAIGASAPLVQEVGIDGAKDVNGDGRDDVVVGFEQTYCFSMVRVCSDYAGTAYVIFGRSGGGTIDTAALGPAGYSIGGTPVGARVAGLGDFNDDGVPDVAVSQHYGDNGWVVFGRRPAANVDLTALGANGFNITDGTKTDVGNGQQVELGSVAWSLAGAGDVNGDHRPDLLVGSGTSILTVGSGERAAAIFGGPSTANLDLAGLGSRGFLITGGNALGYADAAGDANRDGRADLLVNTTGVQGLQADVFAAAVFGKASTSSVDLGSLGSQGVYLSGARPSFAGAGDMTGDRAVDVVIGAPTNSSEGGRAYVVSLRPTAYRRLDELRYYIAGFGLPTVLRDRFFRKLDRIRFAYAGGNQASACRRLDRLIALAQRLNGNRLTGAQAFTIVAGAGRVKDAAGCG